ncbi:TCIM regulator, partial [Crypturellus undulatus]|nr:TCIM regulator [Crypturellus undulatus]
RPRDPPADAGTMSVPLRVSPSLHGARFDTALRKHAAGNIFASVGQDALQRLFRAAGDRRAEERARIVLAAEQDADEKARALTALAQRRRDKLLQFLQLRRYSRKIR